MLDITLISGKLIIKIDNNISEIHNKIKSVTVETGNDLIFMEQGTVKNNLAYNYNIILTNNSALIEVTL